MIEAPEGLVIFDTGDDLEDGEKALAETARAGLVDELLANVRTVVVDGLAGEPEIVAGLDERGVCAALLAAQKDRTDR